MLLRITLLMLVACTTGGNLRPLPPIIPPPNDTQVVPGRRAGVVGIGMTEAQLLQYAGNPQSSSMGEVSMHRFSSYTVGVTGGHVTDIFVHDPAYTLPSGIHVGSTNLEVRAKLGAPVWERAHVSGTLYTMCYPDGTVIKMEAPWESRHVFTNVSSIEVCGCHGPDGPALGCWD